MSENASFQSDDYGSDVGDIESTGIGLSAPNLNHEIRRKLDAMNKLHSTGVQIDIDLPQIAVIGNQSAGKSSLIEAISGITLPRAAGTCTRCPIECRLARTNSRWQCIVSLRITTDATGTPLGQARNEQFGDIIEDKSLVEDRIRRAQRAILNPQKSLDYEFFLNEPEGDATKRLTRQLPFSLNCVTLSISGPDVADLSFCDLPGLIASVSHGGNDDSIALVEKMVTSYIQKPSCIILLTVACETDFENQGAHRLAKQYDPEGKRTIGVLTKPDRIPVGEESSWIPFIRDEKEPLENNWFCVKLPSSFELAMNLTWAQTRRLEEDFFVRKQGPWAELEEPYRKYLGTTNLVERLSTVLSDLIATRVPQIQDELERSIAHTQDLISRLPPPPTPDPRSEILNLLYMFVQDVSQQVKGVPDWINSDAPSGLIQTIRPEQEKFKRSIRATAPEFSPLEKKTGSGGLPPLDFLRAEEGESYEGSKSGKTVAPKNIIYVDEVYDRIQKARTRELPDHVPSIVGETYIRNIIKQWDAPSEALIKAIYNIVTKHLKQMVYDHFHHFGQGKLEQQIRSIVQGHINACLAKAESGVKYQRKLEQSWPFTMNTHYLSDYKEKFLAQYRSAREAQPQTKDTKPAFSFSFSQPPRPSTPAKSEAKAGFMPAIETKKIEFPPSKAPQFPPSPMQMQTFDQDGSQQAQRDAAVAKIIAGFAELGKTGITEADFAKLAPPDQMEPALLIMADVRAYFQVAYKRFIDNVPLAIDVELVTGLVEDLLPTLFSQLGINGPKGDAICKDFAQENRKTATRRVELTKKLERLEAGHKELFAAFV